MSEDPKKRIKKAIQAERVEFTARVRDALSRMNLGDPNHVPDFTLRNVAVSFWGPNERNGGGIGIDWTTESAGCGRCDIYVQDGELRCMNEAMGREFVLGLFEYLLKETRFDD